MQRWNDITSSRGHKSRLKPRITRKDEKEIEKERKRLLIGSVTINVGGRIYKVKRQWLANRKNTLLESVAYGVEEIPSGYVDDGGVYFFDRQPDVFHSVMQFYETGDLHIPSNICSKVVKEELRFWNIRDIRLEPCCWKIYSSNLTDLDDLKKVIAKCSMVDYEYSFLDPLLNAKFWSFYGKLQSTFAVMEYKDWAGNVYNAVSIVITILNFVLTCSISTLPCRYAMLHATRLYSDKGNMTLQEILMVTKPMFMNLGIELLFTVFFVMDQLLRFLASNTTKHFLYKFFNFNDFVCNIVSIFVVAFWFAWNNLPPPLENLSHFFRAMRALRLMRHSRGLMLIFCTIQVRIFDIGFMLVVFLVLVVFCGSAIFISELCGADLRAVQLVNLPTSFFWAGSTLTTVGYGNLVPTSSFSYIIAVITAVSGMCIIFLPIPLLARQFCLYYNIVKLKYSGKPQLMQRLERRRKRTKQTA